MYDWKSPLIQEYSNYYGLEPLMSINKEIDYLLKVSSIRITSDSVNLPIDIDQISEYLKLKEGRYHYFDSRVEEASLRNMNDRFRIELNVKTKNYYRYRFTIAHEIGHFLIRSKIRNEFNKDEIQLIKKHKVEEEILCHYFASELLMPRKSFLSIISDSKPSFELFEKISETYDVSITAAINRYTLAKKNYISLFWKIKKSPTSDINTLRLVWFFPNRYLKNVPFIPLHASAKSERFNPNIIFDSIRNNKNYEAEIDINDFGGLKGKKEVLVLNPKIKNAELFEYTNENKYFDICSIIKY